ncbi:MAG: hypothetical protein OXJ55_12870 [Caldilineaceae bacterium]|nr:hypothetical protein [Caldilineaceae bacterium]
MQQIAAIRELMRHERTGPPVFTKKDLAKIFRDDDTNALNAGLNRLVRNRVLQRAVKGVYVNALSSNQGADTLEHIARAMRRGHHSYISLESALSEYGVISQIPMRLTVMTTGRRGEYSTPFGVIEFTHTARSVLDVINGTVDAGRPLPLATKHIAYRDLKRVGRNLELVNESELDEED